MYSLCVRPFVTPTLFLLCWGLFISNTFAAAVYYDKSVAGSDTINLSSPHMPTAEGSTGDLGYSYDLKLPRGRNGIGANTTLIYSSSNEQNQNVLGYGWTLPMSRISRINKNGVQTMYNEQFFTSSSYGELISSNTGFVAKRSDVTLASFTQIGSGWEVKDNKGLTYLYGNDSNSRQEDSANGHVYAWYLTDVTDRFGNNVHYEYVQDEGYIYPSRITYTNHLGTQGIYELKFNLENRTDALTSYQIGFLVKNNKRIASIDLYISGMKRKTFNLRYGVGANGIRSVLVGITEIGYATDGVQSTLPETTFQYSQPQTEERQFTINGEVDRLADVNGDGLVDFVHSEQKSLDYAGNFKITKDVNINKGNLQFDKVVLQDATGNNSNASTTLSIDGGGLPVVFSRASEAGGTYSKNPEAKFFSDVNGDGYQDIVGAYDTYIASPEKKVASSSSIAATSTLFYTLATSSSLNDPSLTGLSEINADGDKKKDFLMMKNNSQEFLYEQNNSQQLIQQTDANSMSFNKLNTFTLENQQYQVVDLNADGLDDMMRVYVQASNTIGVPDATTTEIWMNKGGVLELLDATNTATYTLPSSLYKGVWNTQTKPVLYADLNFDGIPDVYSHCNSYLTGSGLNMSTTTNNCIAQGSNISAVDLNGDGLTDLLGMLVPNSTPTYWVRLSKYKADLLEKVKNTFGGETSFEYAPASSYTDTANSPANKVGFSTWTVKKEVSNDGVGNISTRSHKYEDAYIDRSDVQEPVFAGFGKVTTTEPNGLKKVTYYHQNNSNSTEELNDSKNKIGNTYKQETYTSTGQLTSQSFVVWKDVDNVSVPETTINREYDISGSGNVFTTAQRVVYDSNLNKINEINYKDVNVNFSTSTVEISDLMATDTLSVDTTYTNSSENTKLFFPQQKTVKDSDGQILLTEMYKYDNQANGVTKGLLTKQTTTASDISQTETFIWDTPYGLLLSQTNNRGATTTNIYDSNMLYPTTVVNALGQNTQFEYDYATGQKVSTVDANGFEVRAEYDGMGRRTKIFKGPAGATNLVEEFQYVDTTLPSARQMVYGSGSTTTSRYFFYDGFGRSVRQLSDSFTDGEYAAKDTYYNQMGQVYKETIPYKTNSISRLPESVPETMNVNYIFDDLGRVTQTTNALGTDKVDYKPRQKTVLDKNNHPTQFIYDTDGLIKTVHEYNQSQEYLTQHEYDVLGNLIKITDAEGAIRQMSYDGFNRKIADMMPSKNSSSQATNFKYAPDDSYADKVSPDNVTLHSEFDIIGRKTRDISQGLIATTTYITIGTTTISTTTFATTTDILNSFVYDNCVNGIGRLCLASSSDGVVKSYEYSKEGQIAKETVSVSNNVWSPTNIVTFTYDILGNLLSRSDGKATTTYDYYRNLVSGITYQSTSQASSTKILDVPVYDFSGRVLSNNRGPLETQNYYDGDKMFRTNNTMSFTTSTSSYPFQALNLSEISTSTDPVTFFPKEFKKPADSIYSLSRGTGSPMVWPTPPYYQYGVNNIWYSLGNNTNYKYVNWNSPAGFVAANRGAADNTVDMVTIWNTYKNYDIATATNPTVDFFVGEKVVELNDDKAYVQVFQRNATNTAISSEVINQCNLSRPYSEKLDLSTISANSYLTIYLNNDFKQDYLDHSSTTPSFLSSCMLEGHTIESDPGVGAGASTLVNKRNLLKLELNYNDLASSTAARPARSLAETMLLYDKANNKPSVQNTNIKLRGQGLYPEVQLVASDPDNHRLVESEIYVATTSATTTSAMRFGGSASSTATVTALLSDYPFGFGGQYFISSRVKDEYGAWSGFATSTFTAASSSATNTVRAYCPGKSLTTLGSVNCPNPTFTVKMFDDSILKYSGYQNIFKPQSVKIIIADNVNLANPIKTITQAVPNTFPLGEMAQVSGRDLRLKKNSKYYYKLELTFGWYNGGTQPLSTHTYTQAPYVFYTGDFKIKQNTDYGYDNLS
jgi:YD repeat-containing protein